MAWFEFNVGADRIEYEVTGTTFDSGLPEAQFNILLEFDFVEVIFMEEDSPQIPSEESVHNIFAASITRNFLLTVVRTIGAFSEVIEAQYESGFQVLPEIQPGLKECLPREVLRESN